MARAGFFTGLDIGTSSIKVLVAEIIDGEMNVIGVSSVKSAGVKDGIIVDIEAAAEVIREAISQAEEKAGITIDKVNVGLPANLLQIEATQGMIPVTSDTKEIKDEDVENVVKSALTKSITPDREVISIVPEEFIIDGFHGIKDPRGMMGVRLEMRGLIYTGPNTILHNLRRTVERAGVQYDNIIISPLALTRSVLNEGEREFGATVIDFGGGQTTVASMRAQELQYTNIYPEGSDDITSDISKVLKTSQSIAESLKFNFGTALLSEASQTDTIPVEVVGSEAPINVTERYISEIIVARVQQIFDRVKQDLVRGRLLDLPGGVVIVGGGAILPGVPELAQEILGAQVKLHVPHQVGIRNPMFASVISLVEYVGMMPEVDIIAQRAIAGEETLRRKPLDFIKPSGKQSNFVTATDLPHYEDSKHRQEPIFEQAAPQPVPNYNPVQTEQPVVEKAPKRPISERISGLFGSMFD